MDDLEYLNKVFESLEKNILDTKELIEYITSEADRLFEEVNKTVDYIYSDEFLDVVFIDTLNEIGKKPIQILRKNAYSAMETSEEFSYDPYENGLQSALRSGESIRISRVGKSSNVFIDMDRVCGNIEEYAAAVKQAREDLGIGKLTKIRPESGSIFWARNIWGVFKGESVTKTNKKGETIDITENYLGKYELTIATRMEYFNSPAPWWSLLDQGNAGGFPEDSGGFPTPNLAPTNFVNKSKLEIEELFNNIFQNKIIETRRVSQEYLDKLNKEIEFWNKKLEKLANKVEEPNDQELIDYARSEIEARIENWETVNYEKMGELAQKLARGERINPKSGVWLGEGNRFRVLDIVNEIYRIFGRFIE